MTANVHLDCNIILTLLLPSGLLERDTTPPFRSLPEAHPRLQEELGGTRPLPCVLLVLHRALSEQDVLSAGLKGGHLSPAK